MSQHESKPERLAPVILGRTPTHAERARTLLETHDQGTLCTLVPPDAAPSAPGGHGAGTRPAPSVGHGDRLAGYPFGSIVNYALDAEGQPILLTSALAEHTRNFSADPRASLFVHETGGRDVLALGRVTLLGRVEAVNEEDARRRYLEQHKEASFYAGFPDFAFYRLRVEAVRYIGGFGRMSWAEVDGYARATPDPTVSFARDAIAHMNEDHAEGLVQLCIQPGGLDGVTAARLTAVDCYGFEMRATTEAGPRVVRLGFDTRVETADEMRRAFIRMLVESRAATGGQA